MRTLSLLPILLSCMALVGCSAVPKPKQYYAEHEYPLLIKMGFAGGPAGHKLVNPAPGMDIGCDEEWAYGNGPMSLHCVNGAGEEIYLVYAEK